MSQKSGSTSRPSARSARRPSGPAAPLPASTTTFIEEAVAGRRVERRSSSM
jgi:hypothetical protein